jgi:hypothetical protein
MVGLVVIRRDVIYMAPNNVQFIFPQQNGSIPSTQTFTPVQIHNNLIPQSTEPLESSEYPWIQISLSMLKIETSVKEVQK